MPAQPPDEWTYLRPEEFADDDAVEQVDAMFEKGAEDAAVHTIDLDEPLDTRRGLDTGETLERPENDEGRPVDYFDDEEPESGPPPESGDDDSSIEPRVDQILVSQHYAFEQEAQ
jgi:hypothetical protein